MYVDSLLENRHTVEPQRERSRIVEQDICAISLYEGKPSPNLGESFVRRLSRQVPHSKSRRRNMPKQCIEESR